MSTSPRAFFGREFASPFPTPAFLLTRLKEILSVWGETSGRIGIGPKKSLKRVKKPGWGGARLGRGLVGRGVPVGTGAHLDLEGDAEGRSVAHPLAHDGREHIELAGGDLEDEFVVNLQQQA